MTRLLCWLGWRRPRPGIATIVSWRGIDAVKFDGPSGAVVVVRDRDAAKSPRVFTAAGEWVLAETRPKAVGT